MNSFVTLEEYLAFKNTYSNEPVDSPDKATGGLLSDALRKASLMCLRATAGAVYATDAHGVATDPEVLQAFKLATMRQVFFWDQNAVLDYARDVNSAAQVERVLKSKSFGGTTVTFESKSSALDAARDVALVQSLVQLDDSAVLELQAVGLTRVNGGCYAVGGVLFTPDIPTFVTDKELAAAVEAAVGRLDLSAYTTDAELKEALANVTVDLTGYVREEALEPLATRAELAGFATKQELDAAVVGGEVDLSAYALKSDVKNVDLSSFYTKQEVDDRIATVELTPGPQGERGPKGDTGDRGPQGPKGDTGPQGPRGETGPEGPAGAPGKDGAVGPAGPKGDTGDRGPQGEVGPKGEQGAPGVDGKDGAIGPKGDTGATGPAGPQGPKGDTGATGPAGATGPQGPKGDAGPTGPQGPKGDAGPRGETGPEGPAGAPGKDGAVGPAGPKGDTGDRGPQGEVGPQGEQGAPGVDGKDGAIGPKGDTGATGPAGPQGPKGDTGATGPAGTTSYSGLTDVPTEFTPKAHSHSIADVNNLQNALDAMRPIYAKDVQQIVGTGGSLYTNYLTFNVRTPGIFIATLSCEIQASVNSQVTMSLNANASFFPTSVKAGTVSGTGSITRQVPTYQWIIPVSPGSYQISGSFSSTGTVTYYSYTLNVVFLPNAITP